MKWLLLALAGLVVLVMVVVAIGWMLPRDHVATVQAKIAAAPESVWVTLTTPSGYPAWRPGLKSVDLLPSVASRPMWREHSSDGVITYVVDAFDAPRRLVTRITNTDLPFAGMWEYAIVPDDRGSRVTIREHGSVYNPVFRFVARLVRGESATAEEYLRALGRKFGQDVSPERLANDVDLPFTTSAASAQGGSRGL